MSPLEAYVTLDSLVGLLPWSTTRFLYQRLPLGVAVVADLRYGMSGTVGNPYR